MGYTHISDGVGVLASNVRGRTCYTAHATSSSAEGEGCGSIHIISDCSALNCCHSTSCYAWLLEEDIDLDQV